MKPLAPVLRSLDAHLRELNRPDHERNPRRFSPPAPMPDDPMVCRWCQGRLVELADTARTKFCQAGCSSNDAAERVGHCVSCHRDYETGAKHTVLCHGCDEAEARLVRREHAGAVPAGRDEYGERRREREKR